MVLEYNEVIPFMEWLPSAALQWFLVVVCVAVVGVLIGWFMSAMTQGPGEAMRSIGRLLASSTADLVRLSPRRTAALAWLAVKESIRRRVVVVFAVFMLLLLFAGWFLDPGSPDPARLYLNFVLTATGYLVLLLALFLGSQSLPNDIKNRTLQTIVTKPVRTSEIVLGRMLGFLVVISVLIAVMGAIGYVFVIRGLAHTHEIAVDDLRPMESAGGQTAGRQGRTSTVHKHWHKVYVEADGRGRVDPEQNHWHDLEGQWKDLLDPASAGRVFHLGPPEGMLQARVPLYGKLRFLDRKGEPAEKGVNTGDEWTYRSYVEGGTLAAAIWTFDGVTEARFPHGLPVEMTIGVFRTYKANIEKGVLASLWVRNPASPDNKPVRVRVFESKEFATDVKLLEPKILAPDGQTLDLFKDFVHDGKIEIWLRCEDMAQYIGAAQPDLYLRAADASFLGNFVKGYVGIWLQSLLMVSLGVTFSTFLSAPIAMMATLGAMVGGFFHQFMYELATKQTYGGGPFESFVRMLTQQNVTGEMEPGLRTTIVQTLDQPAEAFLWSLSQILPDFSRFSFAEFVASGFNVPGDTVLVVACRAFAFALPMFVAAYIFLKNREMAQQ
jgi:hypothetical protein